MDNPNPNPNIPIYPYQDLAKAEIINQLTAKGSSALLAPTGSGKTRTATAVAHEQKLSVIVVCPLQAMDSWQRELKLWKINVIDIVNYEMLREGSNRDANNKSTVCSYLTPQYRKDSHKGKVVSKFCGYKWNLPNNTLLIYDEAHKGKNGLISGHTKNSTLIASSRSAIDLTNRKYVLLLSATITDGIESADVLCYVLTMYKPYEQGTYERFLKTNKITNMVMLMNILVPKFAVKMVPVGNTEFPDKIKCIKMELRGEGAKRIEELHAIMEAKAAEAEQKAKKLTLTDIVAEWQELELLKVPLFVAKIARWRSKNFAVMMFVNFTNTRIALHDQIRKEQIPAVVTHLHGGMTKREKDQVVDAFKADEYDVVIGMIKCAGESVEFQDVIGKKQRRSIVSQCMSGIATRQAFGRIDRTGKKSPTKQCMIFVKNSPTEERIADVQAKKIKNLQHVGGGLLTIEQDEPDCAVLHEDLDHLEI